MLDKCFKHADNAVFLNNEGFATLFNASNAHIVELNEVASYIWQSIDGVKSALDIIDRIIDTYDIDRDAATNDVYKQVHYFLESGFIDLV